MNSGAEAVESAIKSVRKWGYEVKGVPDGQAEIIVCADNFHGRTLGIIGFSTDEAAPTIRCGRCAISRCCSGPPNTSNRSTNLIASG